VAGGWLDLSTAKLLKAAPRSSSGSKAPIGAIVGGVVSPVEFLLQFSFFSALTSGRRRGSIAPRRHRAVVRPPPPPPCAPQQDVSQRMHPY
jgi:hypothetical protein